MSTVHAIRSKPVDNNVFNEQEGLAGVMNNSCDSLLSATNKVTVYSRKGRTLQENQQIDRSLINEEQPNKFGSRSNSLQRDDSFQPHNNQYGDVDFIDALAFENNNR